MTTPNLTRPGASRTVLIADVAWPAHKALAVLVAVLVLVGTFLATSSDRLAFALAMAGGMLVWWIFSPRSAPTRSR